METNEELTLKKEVDKIIEGIERGVANEEERKAAHTLAAKNNEYRRRDTDVEIQT